MIEDRQINFALIKQFPQHPLPVIHKVLRNLKMFRILVIHPGYTLITETVDGRVGVGEEQGGVGCYDKLGRLLYKLVNTAYGRQLPGRRKRRFGLIQNVDAIPEKAVHQKREKGLPVGLAVKGFSPV